MAKQDAGVYRTVGTCRVCKHPMLSKHAWALGVRREDHVRKGIGDLCHRHMERLRKHGSLRTRKERGQPRYTGPGRTRQEILEDYTMIRDEVSSVRQAAERMGMTFSALDKALYRARLDGVAGAMPPPNQVDRALALGSVYTSRAA